jgi:Sugar-transfer associated ATP-grasp
MPPGACPKAATFLYDYYASSRRKRSPAGLIRDTLVRLALIAWLPFRILQVALWDKRSFGWCLSTICYSALNFTDPLEVSLFGLAAGSGAEFMRRFELGGVMRALNPVGWERGCVLNDKELFRLHCEQNGLPSPRWFATAGGRSRKAVEEPEVDLILKPSTGRGGKGIRWAKFAQGLFYVGAAKGVTYEQLLERLRSQAREYVVHKREHNHPVLARFGTPALSTARMTTCLNEDGTPELVVSYLRIALQKDAIVDNIAAGGLIAAIDPASGHLKEGMVGKHAQRMATHPLSGASIEGTQLPFWGEAKDLVIRAHTGFKNRYTCIAWDVAFTETGAILIEGNTKPCIIIQRATGIGLGASRFGQLIEFHLRRHALSA